MSIVFCICIEPQISFTGLIKNELLTYLNTPFTEKTGRNFHITVATWYLKQVKNAIFEFPINGSFF